MSPKLSNALSRVEMAYNVTAKPATTQILPMASCRGFAVQVTEVTRFKKSRTQVRESRRQIRSMAASREDALEPKTQSIARELHDELGQLLTGLKMDLSVLKMQSNDPKRWI